MNLDHQNIAMSDDDPSGDCQFERGTPCISVQHFLLSVLLHAFLLAGILYFGSQAAGFGGMPGPGEGDGIMMISFGEGGDGPSGGSSAEDGQSNEPRSPENDSSEVGETEEAGEDNPREPDETVKEPETPETALEEVFQESLAEKNETEQNQSELNQPEPDPESIPLKVAEAEQPPPEVQKAEAPKKKPKTRPAKAVEVKKDAAAAGKPPEEIKRGNKAGGQAYSAGRGQGEEAGPGGAGRGRGAKSGGGGGGGGNGTAAGYVKANYSYILKHIRRNMSYPPQAKKQGITGTVGVTFTITKSGQATNISISKSSGDLSLDQAAAAAVKRASPFPAPPEAARINVSLTFGLR